MVSAAPDPAEGIGESLEIALYVVGQPIGSPNLALWKEQLLQARLLAHSAPALALVAVVNAIDLFIEHLSGEPIRPPRPQTWLRAIESRTGLSLNASEREELSSLVHMRNSAAHGHDYFGRLSANLANRELIYRERAHLLRGEGVMAPSVSDAFRTSLRFLRQCRHMLATESSVAVSEAI